jgi:hypothetical protein
MTPAERMQELAADPYIRDTEIRASLEFHRSAYENAPDWWVLEKQAFIVHPSNPSEKELRRALRNPAETMVVAIGELAASEYATAIIVANVRVAMFSIQGPELEPFIRECIRAYTDKACKLLRPASEDEESRNRVAHLIDLYATNALTSMRMVSHAQAALKNGMKWDEVTQMLPRFVPPDDVIGNESRESDETAEERSTRRHMIVDPWMQDADIKSAEMWATKAGGNIDKNTPRDYLSGKTKTLRAESRIALARALNKGADELPK